jgi:gamma-butyrobetaine dioxygenase
VPTQEREVLSVIDTFGFTRVTNYRELFDVRIEENPINLAFTNPAIAPHTGNPYGDPIPTLQLLHCLETNVEGGDSGLVDGFAVADALRDQDAQAFDLLC